MPVPVILVIIFLGIVLGVQDNSIIYNVETDVNFIALINIEELLVKAKANNVSLIQNEKNIFNDAYGNDVCRSTVRKGSICSN